MGAICPAYVIRMAAAKNNKINNEHGTTAAQVVDPFAVDLFAAGDNEEAFASSDSSFSTLSSLNNADAAVSWNARLPSASSEQAGLSRLTQTLPVALTAHAQRTLAQTLARFTNQSLAADASVSVELISAREIEFTTEAFVSRNIFINLAVEPEAARLTFALPINFAVRLIDCVLGGSGESTDETQHRELAVVEQAVIEFICLNIVQQFNREAESNLFRFDSLTNTPPAWLPSDVSARAESAARGVLLVTRIILAPATECLARGFVPSATLRALDVSTNKMLRRQNFAQRRMRAQAFKALVADVNLRLRVGETSLSAADLTEIERGDVVLLTQVYADSGYVLVFAGDGDNVQLTGRLHVASGANQPYALLLEKINSSKPMTLKERWQMKESSEEAPTPDDQGDDEIAESAARLENLMLTLHVEFAARRISLEELAGLEPNQIIELGCRATDPVELIVDERAIARGELIDIEGRLGVRITHVLR